MTMNCEYDKNFEGSDRGLLQDRALHLTTKLGKTTSSQNNPAEIRTVDCLNTDLELYHYLCGITCH
jgi:uncharacterized protein YjhX (UPF0386 family)